MTTQSNKTEPKKAQSKSKYHHGNLREDLILASVNIINQEGIDGLSLRKLAEQLGVSRMAPYHHFKDKNALLAAVALQGFERLSVLLNGVFKEDIPLIEQLRKAVKDYLRFAIEHPTQYDLMFGSKLWNGDQFEDFQRQAKDCFRLYVTLFEQLKSQKLLSDNEDPLRLSQLLWATLHGLAKLTEEGLFSMANSLDDITDYALKRFEDSLTITA